MGARLYNPTAGRFTSTDQVEGGSPSAYAYPTDPINSFGLDGLCWSLSRAASSVWRATGSASRWLTDSRVGRRINTACGYAWGGCRRGSCFDNAAAEAFFSTLEWEVLSRHDLRTLDQAQAVVLDWCYGFYNHDRRHSTIGMVSPVTYENTAAPDREAA